MNRSLDISSNLPEEPPIKKLRITQPSFEEQKAFISGLRTLFPKSAVINVFFPKPEQSSQSKLKKLPCTIMSCFHPRYQKLSTSELQEESLRVFKELSVSDSEAKYLTHSTQLQSRSSVWYEHRKGRLTASRFRSICHTSPHQPSRSLIGQVLQQTPPPKSAALQWGIEKEEIARMEYEREMKAIEPYIIQSRMHRSSRQSSIPTHQGFARWAYQMQLLW